MNTAIASAFTTPTRSVLSSLRSAAALGHQLFDGSPMRSRYRLNFIIWSGHHEGGQMVIIWSGHHVCPSKSHPASKPSRKDRFIC